MTLTKTPQTKSPSEKAQEYLTTAHLYHLGDLPTEQLHPKTLRLSQLASADLPSAIQLIREVDSDALTQLLALADELEPLKKAIQETWDRKGRVYICGCGATGRLALNLEILWRETCPLEQTEKVIGFMAGGDVALLRSIENFEDFPEYGARHLADLGFTARDLLISVTEGGETPYVIGATIAAANLCAHKTFFIYCNPRDILIKTVERSRKILEHSKVHGISLPVGPMALSGSTRLQASTILQAAVGVCLLPEEAGEPPRLRIQRLLDAFDIGTPASKGSLIECESEVFEKREGLHYLTQDLGITVLTDTTERHPTFNIPAFENIQDPGAPLSPCYLIVPGTTSPEAAWIQILHRAPRTLNWKEHLKWVSSARIMGFDLSDKTITRRSEAFAPRPIHQFKLSREASQIKLDFVGGPKEYLACPVASRLHTHLLLKMYLNTHSTLVMGRLKRFQGNVMTWVKPSNGKLVDRAIRYVRFLFETESLEPPGYDATCLTLFEALETAQPNESLVLRVFEQMSNSGVSRT